MDMSEIHIELNNDQLGQMRFILREFEPGDDLKIEFVGKRSPVWHLIKHPDNVPGAKGRVSLSHSPDPKPKERWIVEPEAITELIEMIDLKPWQVDRVRYWLDHRSRLVSGKEEPTELTAGMDLTGLVRKQDHELSDNSWLLAWFTDMFNHVYGHKPYPWQIKIVESYLRRK